MTFIDKDVCMVIYDKVIKPMGFMTETGMTMRVILDVPVDNVYSVWNIPESVHTTFVFK